MSSPLNSHSDAAMQLSHCIDEALAIPGIDLPACEQLRERVSEGRFNLVVVGEFNRGKSSVINALLGASVMPVGVVPLTSVLTEIRYGAVCRCTACFLDGTERDITLEEMADFATERGNPGNAKSVAAVRLEYPSPWLSAGVRLFDTPGIGSLHQQNSDVTHDFLPQADAVLFVASVDQAMGRAELDFLIEIRRHAAKVVCLLNKADHLTEGELREAEAFAGAAAHEALSVAAPVIALSARQALEGQVEGNAHLVQQSGLVALRAVLRRLLGEERLGIWVESLSSGLLRILARCRLSADLETTGLTVPVAKLEASVVLFRRKKTQGLQAVADDDVLVVAEAKKLVADKVVPDLERFKTDLQATLVSGIQTRYEEIATLPSARLHRQLEDYVIGAVKAVCEEWRISEEADLLREFEALRGRLWRHVEDIADELLRESAQLFALPYETVHTESLGRPPAGFRYKFWDEPASMRLLSASLVQWLPNIIAAPAIRRRMQRRAADLVEIHAGRLRHHFEEQLKHASRQLRADLRLAFQSTLAGLENALASGVALRQRSVEEMAARSAVLANTVSQIEALSVRVGSLSSSGSTSRKGVR